MITLYGIGGQTGPDMSVLVRVRPRARDNGDGGLTLSRPLVDPVDEIANTPAEAALGKPGPEPFARN